MKAGDYRYLALGHPEEQPVWKSPKLHTTDVLELYRKLLGVGRDPLDLNAEFILKTRAQAGAFAFVPIEG